MNSDTQPKSGKTGTLVSQLGQVSGRIFAGILRKHNLGDFSGARGRVLFCLWQQDGVPVKTLAQKTSLDKSTLTGILDRLERDGYILRQKDPDDSRALRIMRTGKDSLFQKKMPLVSAEMNAIFYKGFTDSEIATLDSLLQRALDNCLE